MELRASRIEFSIQSSTVNTDIIQNIPIVIPKSDRKVRNLLTTTDLMANKNPSLKSLKDIFELFSTFIGMPKVRKSFVFD
jgi:hypothetical protein